ncbi:MaoC/PaaZ C-terminal domain-containing protein [Streptomyces spirodelae]|uniref:Dehydratase n=1 Tax=Streptomyces spirodelae TaxID=2812904 RepID=A0ABS3WMF6_9ACTN|nr:MaoC/PaaZ C-terminal domain-containing protein [Streptomyces spirodelae]MBO8184310.1 dehydratase [Streptomyces spirodelae]
MRNFSGLDELVSAKGQHLGYSEWLEITPERVEKFAQAAGDSPRPSGNSGNSGTPDSPAADPAPDGFLMLGLLPSMMRAIFTVERSRTGVNFGLERVRFPRPVRVGARVRGGAELTGAQGVPGGWLVSARMTVEIQEEPRPACVADTVSLFLV